MPATVSKWGNSLAVRIPKRLARSSGLSEGTVVEIDRRKGGGLELRPVGASLSSLLDRVTSDNVHGEVSFGDPVGRETL